MKYDLISIGSVTKDIFVITGRGKIFKTPRDLLSPFWLGFEAGEKICADEIIESAGGVATNLSIGTKRLGLKSFPIGPKNPPVSVIVVDRKTGERVIFYQKSSGKIDLGALKSMKARWLSVSSLTGNWSKEAGDILAYAKREKAKLILAPSTSMIREGYNNLKNLLENAEIIFLNWNEAIEIVSKSKIGTLKKKYLLKYVFKYLHSLGPKIVCLTEGRKGAWVSDGEKTFHSPIQKVKTVDATGAGDAFAAGFLGIYLKGGSIEKSLKMGIRNGANVVRFVGTTKGLLGK